MKSTNTIPLFLLLIGLYACQEQQPYFVGKWQIINVVENSEKVDLDQNWIHLHADGTFSSYDGELEKREKGTWSYEQETKLLFVNGEGDVTDSHWNLDRRNDSLIFKSTESAMYLIAVKVEK